jgi:hypothetical protein
MSIKDFTTECACSWLFYLKIIDVKSENESEEDCWGGSESESKLERGYKAERSATELGSSTQGKDRHKLTGSGLKSIRFNHKHGFQPSFM